MITSPRGNAVAFILIPDPHPIGRGRRCQKRRPSPLQKPFSKKASPPQTRRGQTSVVPRKTQREEARDILLNTRYSERCPRAQSRHMYRRRAAGLPAVLLTAGGRRKSHALPSYKQPNARRTLAYSFQPHRRRKAAVRTPRRNANALKRRSRTRRRRPSSRGGYPRPRFAAFPRCTRSRARCGECR